MDILERFRAVIRRSLFRVGYAAGGAKLVVAVSGGPDSMSLMHCLADLKEELGLSLHVGHLNHNGRGEEAEEDARFVSEAAQEFGLGVTIGKASPIDYQRRYQISSYEEASREIRYDFLCSIAKEQEADAIVLGHTSDDQAETSLLHILRGSGIPGLGGMQEMRVWKNPRTGVQGTLFRPLLEVGRVDTTAYCDRLGVGFRHDSSNVSMKFTRNRVRHQLFPVLEKYNPRIREAILRLGRAASLVQSYLDQEVEEVWGLVASTIGESIVLNIAELNAIHPLLHRLIMRRAYKEARGNFRKLQESHLIRMADMINGSGGAISLPDGLTLRSRGDILVLGKSSDEQCPYPVFQGEYPLDIPGTTNIPGWTITTEMADADSCHEKPEKLVAYLDEDCIGLGLRARTRRAGDRFYPLGMEQEKKIQDFYVDQKVPRSWRDRIPLVLSDKGILWVVGERVSNLARLTNSTRRVVTIRWYQTHTNGSCL